MSDAASGVGQVRDWLRAEVVGWDLCPYAAGPLAAGRVRFVWAPGDLEARLRAVAVEAERLLGSRPSRLETTLVIMPDANTDFERFMDETALAMELVDEIDAGSLQVVAFHPSFRFDGASPDDPGNRTNRSPVALWHLLRQASIDRVVEADPARVASIPERNRRFLEARSVVADQVAVQVVGVEEEQHEPPEL